VSEINTSNPAVKQKSLNQTKVYSGDTLRATDTIVTYQDRVKRIIVIEIDKYFQHFPSFLNKNFNPYSGISKTMPKIIPIIVSEMFI